MSECFKLPLSKVVNGVIAQVVAEFTQLFLPSLRELKHAIQSGHDRPTLIQLDFEQIDSNVRS